MWTILILFVLVVIGVRVFVADDWSDFWSYGFIFTIIGWVCSLILIAFASLFVKQHEVKYEITHKIVSLDDTSGTEGAFFLGIGAFGTGQAYNFYYVVDGEENTYKRKRVDASNTYIKEGYDDARVVYHYEGTSIKDKNMRWVFNYGDRPSVVRIDLFVPEGTIIKEIGLDNRK